VKRLLVILRRDHQPHLANFFLGHQDLREMACVKFAPNALSMMPVAISMRMSMSPDLSSNPDGRVPHPFTYFVKGWEG
jgi:hypothetical protein